MKPRIVTKKTLTVEARDGYDRIRLVPTDVEKGRGQEDVPGIRFDHFSGRTYNGNLVLDLDTAEEFADAIKRYVDFQRYEVEG